MSNFKLQTAKYFITWWTVMTRPIFFYAKLKEEDWKEGALTFFLISSWLLAVFLALAVFVTQYFTIGSTLIEGISGWKFLIILPVLLTLALVFFLITLAIIGGMLIAGLGALFYVVAWGLHYLSLMLGGKGSLNKMIQNIFYSSGVMLAGILPAGLVIMTKYNCLSFELFRVGFNFCVFLTLLFIYGLWAVAVRRNYALLKAKAFLVAFVPVLFLLIFGLVFDKMALPKLASWITPLK